MGNTPSSEETNNKTLIQKTNMQNSNNPNGASSWQPSNNMAPNAAAPIPPGWSVSSSSQQVLPNRQANTSVYPPLPPAYDSSYQTKQPVVGPQNPTAPPFTNYMPQRNPQPSHIPPQTFGKAPTAAAPQYYTQTQTFMHGEKNGPPQFYAQPQVFAAHQQQPTTFYSQQPVASGNRPQHIASMPLSSASMGLDSGSWLKCTSNSIPTNAFRAGHDTDGSVLLVCRASHAGDLLPGKVVPNHSCAYVAYGGQEHAKRSFEVLVGDRFRWIQAHGCQIPQNAVEGGRSSQGEKLYIGRARHENSLTPGKVHPSHKCLYIAYGGKEIHFSEYEILVYA